MRREEDLEARKQKASRRQAALANQQQTLKVKQWPCLLARPVVTAAESLSFGRIHYRFFKHCIWALGRT